MLLFIFMCHVIYFLSGLFWCYSTSAVADATKPFAQFWYHFRYLYNDTFNQEHLLLG